MTVVQWFIAGAVLAGLLWFWRWCVRWARTETGNIWGAMAIGLFMIPTAAIWIPIALVVKLCTNHGIRRRLEALFPPL